MKQVLIILVLAIIVRICFLVVAMPEGIEIHSDSTSDAPRYDELALNIINGHWFFDKDRPIFTPPAHPLFLAGIYSVFGHHYEWARIIQALFWTIICVLIFFLGKELFNRKVGFIAGLIAAFYPPFIIESIVLLRETLFTFFLICLALCFIRAVKRDSLKYFGASGLFLGLTALTRPIILYFLIFILLYLLFIYKSKKRAVLSFVILIIVGAAIVGPWSIRNYIQSQNMDPSVRYPMTIVSGKGLESGIPTYNALKSEIEIERPSLLYKFYKIYRFPHNLFYFESSQYRDTINRLAKGQANVKELFFVLRQKMFWMKSAILIIYFIILISCLIGIVCLRKKWKIALPLLLLIGYISGAPLLYKAVMNPAPRYKFYIMPFVIILAAYGIYILFQKYYSKKRL